MRFKWPAGRFLQPSALVLGLAVLLAPPATAAANEVLKVSAFEYPSAALVPELAVRGRITSKLDGSGLPGVTVVVKGTTNGTATDANGNFSLTVAGPGAVLVVSFIGYTTQEVTVGNKTEINIALVEDAKALEEVVVVGYGTQKKASVTGAVSSVSAADIANRPGGNPTLMLQGKVPGLQITQNSAQPGTENANIRVRGQGTFSGAGNNPLVIIDGVEGSLSNLNPNMIENISVLKDASSAAIYGSRAANGVILVTTKQGAEGRLNIDYNYNYNIQKPTALPELITNSVEYMEMVNKAIDHTGTSTNLRYPLTTIEAYRNGQATDPLRYPNTNWMDIMFKRATMQQHFLGVNGGKGGTTYNFGLGILDQEGMMRATDARKYDAMLNFRSKLGDRVTFGTNINFTNNYRHEPSGGTQDIILSTYAQHPNWSPYLWDGSGRYSNKAYQMESTNKNPVGVSDNGGRYVTNNYALATAFMDVDITKDLKAQVKGSFRYDVTQNKLHNVSIPTFLFQPDPVSGMFPVPAQNQNGNEHTLTVANTTNQQLTFFSTLNYNRTFGEVHTVSALAGYSQETFRNDELQGFRRNYASPELTELGPAPRTGQTSDGGAYEWAIQSLFGRLNYDYKGKYLLEASFRQDGSSRFRQSRRWGFFPSMSAGWRLSEESFLKGITFLDELKLRGSWGQLGNQNIGNYPYQSLLGFVDYEFGSFQQGVTQLALNNEDITWETSTVADLGLDFSLLTGKIYGSADVYSKKTTDILRPFQVPNFVGRTPPTINGGEMLNTGLELALGHRNTIGDFTYNISGNFETYKNEVTKYGNREINGDRIRQEGLPYNSHYILQWIGVFQSQDEISTSPVQQNAPKPGDLKYADINNDKKVDANDRVVVQGAFPKFNYGFNLSAGYKGFDASLFFQGVEGRKVLVKEWGIAPFRQYGPPPTFWREAWTPENKSQTMPAIYNDSYAQNTVSSTWWLRDASYLRLKNLQVGYSLPQEIAHKVKLQKLRVYFSGDNLLTFTNYYSGGDPERVDEGRFAIYPQAQIFSFGIRGTL